MLLGYVAVAQMPLRLCGHFAMAAIPHASPHAPARPAVARKVRAGQDALAAGEAERALVLAEAACEGSVPAAEPAVRLRVEALLQLGRQGRGRVGRGGAGRHVGSVVQQLLQGCTAASFSATLCVPSCKRRVLSRLVQAASLGNPARSATHACRLRRPVTCRHAEAVAEARNMTLGGDAQAPEVLALRSQALYLCGGWRDGRGWGRQGACMAWPGMARHGGRRAVMASWIVLRHEAAVGIA